MGSEHFERAVRYAARFGGDAPSAFAVHGDPDLAVLLDYAAEHADIRMFARELAGLHRAMLRYYVQMRYLTPAEAQTFGRGRIPLLTPLRATRRHPVEEGDGPLYTDPLPADLSGALLNTFARNIHHALACRARTELFQTLSAHAQGNAIATEARGAERNRASPSKPSWNGGARVSWSMTGRSRPCWRAFTSGRCTR